MYELGARTPRDISILAPHEGERLQPRCNALCSRCISILAPHEGERLTRDKPLTIRALFQSSLPTRGSDAHIDAERRKKRYFNPRSPRGGATHTTLR